MSRLGGAIGGPPQQIESPKQHSTNPEQSGECEVFKIAERSERRSNTGQHRYQSCSQSDAQRPRGLLQRKTVASMRERYTRTHGENKQRESADEEHMEEVDPITRNSGNEPQ